MPLQDEPILIAGGGIGGLAATLALANAGRRVVAFEKARTFSEVGAGIQLGPNGYRMLDRLGVAKAASELAVFPDKLVMMDSVTGDEVTRIPLGPPFPSRFGHPYSLIHRADLHAVLLDGCRRLPSVTLHNGHEIERFEQTPDGVRLVLDNGATHDGCALIGADGLWSKVRARVIGDGAPRVSGHVAYRAVLPTGQVPPEFRRNDMLLWAGPKNYLVQYPLRGGDLFNLAAVLHSACHDEGWNSYGDPEELNSSFDGVCSTVQTLLRQIESWRMLGAARPRTAIALERRPRNPARKRGGPHGAIPRPRGGAGAGGCGGAGCEVAAPGENLAAAFQSYQKKRYLRAGRCQIMARVYGEFYHASGVRREMRNAMLSAFTTDGHYAGTEWLYSDL